MKRLLIILVIIGLFSLFLEGSGFASDQTVETSTKAALQILNINVQSVELSDGTAKGGVRGLIISYTINPSRSKHVGELTSVLECGFAANNSMNANIDETSAVVGDALGNAIGVFSVKVSKTRQFFVDKDAEKYARSWNVLLLNRNYFVSFAQLFGW